MDRTLPPAVTGFGKLHAGVFAPASIEQVETPIRECGPYQSGKRVNNAAELVSIPVFSSVGVKSAIYPPMSIILWCDAAMAALVHLVCDQSVAHSCIHPPTTSARAASSKLNNKIAGTPLCSGPVKMPAPARNQRSRLTRELGARSWSTSNGAT